MRIEKYFQHYQAVIQACPSVQTFNIAYDKRSTHEGFIKGQITFVDGSILHLREFVDTETEVDRLAYVYQYMKATKKLLFRYDNTGHHRKLNLASYPHHKHDGSEDNVVISSAPDLSAVLREIQNKVVLPT